MSDPEIHLSDCFVPAPRVMSRELDGEAVLLDLASGRYFGLNPTGRRIWELLAPGTSLESVLDRLEAEFEAPRAELEADLVMLVGRLEAAGLVLRAAPLASSR